MKNLIILSLIVFSMACQKAQRDEDTATNTAEDVSLAQSIYSDAYKNMRLAALGTKGISDASESINTIYGCELIKSDTTVYPRTITIDFKYIGCEGLSVVRRGRIIGEFYGKYPEVNSAMDLTFSNYYFEDYEVDGGIRVIFKESSSQGYPVNSFYVQNGSINSGDNPMSWTASQSWEQLPDSDDASVFEITGNSNGVNRKGNVFFAEIDKLSLTDDCVSIIDGNQELQVLNLSNRNVKYQGQACSNSGTVIINGSQIPFTY